MKKFYKRFFFSSSSSKFILLLLFFIFWRYSYSDTSTKYCVIQGYVRDKTTRQPNAGVKVQLDRDRETTITDSDGFFQFYEDPKYFSHDISVGDDNLYSPLLEIDTRAQDTVNVILETKPGGILRGMVINQLKDPVVGASLSCFAEGQNYSYIRHNSDSNGEFKISSLDLDASSFSLWVTATGYNQLTQSNIQFPPGQKETYITITLTSTVDTTNNVNGPISGNVTDDSGAPIEGATVASVNPKQNFQETYQSTSTDSQGLFSFGTVSYPYLVVLATASTYAPAWKQIKSSQDSVLHLTLTPSHYVGGKIVDQDRNPIQYVSADVHFPNSYLASQDGPNYSVKRLFQSILKAYYGSDPEGLFHIDGLSGDSVTLGFSKYGYTSIRDTTLKVDRDDYLITLLSSGQIAGSVVDDESGKPINPIHVALRKSKENPQNIRYEVGVTAYEQRGATFFKEDGTFSIPNLESNIKYKVTVKAEGYRQEEKDPVLPNTDTTNHNRLVIRLKKIKPTNGFVLENLTGKGIPGVLVTAFQPFDDQSRSYNWGNDVKGSITTTDANGHFQFPNLPYTQGLLAFQKPGFGKTMLFNVDYSNSIEQRLTKAATVTVILKKQAEGSKDIIYTFLSKYDGSESVNFDSTKDKKANLFFADLPSGAFIFIIGNQTQKKTTQTGITLVEGQNYILDLSGESKVRIFGKVTWKGAPASNVYLWAYDQDSTSISTNAQADKNGNYELIFSDSGNYRINFTKELTGPTPKYVYTYRFLSADSGDYRLDVNMPDSVAQGLLMNPKFGKSIPNVPVTAYQKKKEYDNYTVINLSSHSDYTSANWVLFQTVTTNQNGQFTFEPLDAGDWLIAEESSSRISFAGKPFKLKANETNNSIVLRQPETGSLELSVVDEDSGNLLIPAEINCADSTGYIYSPSLEKDSTGKIIYPSLPPGNYKAYARTDDHLEGFTEFEIMPGKKTISTIKLQKGGRLVITIKGKNNILEKKKVLAICKILQAKSGAPVLQDTNGGYKRYILTFTSHSPDTSYLPLPPGDYTVEVQTKIVHEKAVFSIPISRQTKLLKVEQAKDIPWEINLSNLK